MWLSDHVRRHHVQEGIERLEVLLARREGGLLHLVVVARLGAQDRAEHPDELVVEEVALHDRRRRIDGRRLEQTREVADVEPLLADQIRRQPARAAHRAREERAVDPAGARAAQDVDHELAIEGLREAVVDGSVDRSFVRRRAFRGQVRSPGAVELDRAAAHPDREADAAVQRHRDADLFGQGIWLLIGDGHRSSHGYVTKAASHLSNRRGAGSRPRLRRTY